MPIYEYLCATCQADFEQRVTGGREPFCPHCGGQDLRRKMSRFALVGASSPAAPRLPGPCGTCGDPRGPGSCARD